MIIWLASYPKSGNTWLRFFILSLFFGDKGEILKALPKEGERAKTATVRMIASKQILIIVLFFF